MGMVELLLLLFAIASVAHYLFGWAVYIEKQLELVRVGIASLPLPNRLPWQLYYIALPNRLTQQWILFKRSTVFVEFLLL